MQESEGEEQRTVFISNLSSCVKEEILYELFLQAGPVQKVVIPRGRDGNQKSYGFVRYKHAEAVPYAIALLDGIWLYGCPIILRRHYTQTLTARDDHSWTDVTSARALVPFSPIMCTTQGPYFPPLTPGVWPSSGFVSWSSCPDVLTQASDRTISEERGEEQDVGMEREVKGRRNCERRNKLRREYRS
ncbi:hypothetical protein C0J50_4460 [Silurus asotus]|uniref:RRM domain-containing protein n=1 Tax=Silurus asotus TaxID=30991 RepID=A0AAD5A9T8_SILAS|nr:hypothetical protein C0J50_4460 [Silurus asotus]